MGIQSFIQRRRQEREKKKAIEAGKILTSKGITSTTPKTTTGSYVTSQGEVNVTSSGRVVTTTNRVNNSSGRTTSGIANEVTTAPPNVISPAPTQSEVFKQEQASRGTINAAARYVPNLIQKKVYEYQIQRAARNPNYQLYQPKATANLAGFATGVAQYSVPVAGTGLLIGSGTETLTTGRAKKEYNKLIEEGYSKAEATTIAYGAPAAEVGLGLFGLKGEKNLFIKKITKEPVTTFNAYVTREGGVSNVNVVSRTGKDLSISTEKVIGTDTGLFVGGGKGFRGEGKIIKEFQTVGGGKELPNADLVKVVRPTKISSEIGTGISSTGYSRDTGGILKEERKFYNPFTNKMELPMREVNIEPKVIKKPSPFVRQNIFGTITPQTEEGISQFIGTNKPIVRVYKKGGVSYIIKKPNIRGDITVLQAEPEVLKISKAGSVERTPFSKTFPLSAVEKQSIVSQIQVPKTKVETIKPTRTNLIASGNVIQTRNEVPFMVGGTGLTSVPYSGTSQYEVQQTMGFVNPVGKSETKQLSFTKSGVENVQNKIIQRPIQIEEQINILKQPQPQTNIQKEIQRYAQPSPQIYKQTYKQQQKNKFKFPIILEKTQGIKSGNIFKLSPKTKNIFEAFLKRRGKDISLGKFEDIGSAKGKFLKEVKSTLGASGFITKNKEVVPLKELNLGNEFTPSKKQPLFRAVQRRGFRLSSRGEVSEILSSKKAKGRKVKWL